MDQRQRQTDGAIPVQETEGQAPTVMAAWRSRFERTPDAPAIAYFDTVMSVADVDGHADALAVALSERGVTTGQRVGIHLQNIPQYAIAMLALWKLGATAVVLNPMYLGDELLRPVADSGAIGVITTDRAVDEVRESVQTSAVQWVIGTSERDLQTRNDPRMFADETSVAVSADGDLVQLMHDHAGGRPAPFEPSPEDLALLTHTSGTTGPPKGAMNSHHNVVTVATTFGRLAGVESGDVVLAIAPLFHITGAVINAARLEHAGPEHFAAVKTLYSGGAPIPPSTVERFEERFGHYIHNAYGMTETTSGVIAVPPGERAPVDESSGTLSIGKALPGLTATAVDVDDREVAPGEQGELVMSGPQVVSGYWRNPEATEATMPGGRLHSGDGAVIDEHGWVYLVDRLKDQINTSGYKVWPREVEDVLYEHPAVYEVAVVGLPDEYRGEVVTAFVSLKDGQSVDEETLRDFASGSLAAYKRPRSINIIPELPKTQTGKIRRRALREEAS